MQKQAYVSRFGESTFANLAVYVSGVCLLALLAKISIHLPFTPVPVTGQTFGVTLIALLWGAKRAPIIIASYLLLGLAGLPIFAAGATIASYGYLVGMFFASFVIGFLADRGWAKKFSSALVASLIGSVVIFSFGLLGLHHFVPGKSVFALGLAPFLLGDLIKDTLASLIASAISKK